MRQHSQEEALRLEPTFCLSKYMLPALGLALQSCLLNAPITLICGRLRKKRVLPSLHVGLRRHALLHVRHLHAVGVGELVGVASNVLHCHAANALCL